MGAFSNLPDKIISNSFPTFSPCHFIYDGTLQGLLRLTKDFFFPIKDLVLCYYKEDSKGDDICPLPAPTGSYAVAMLGLVGEGAHTLQ